MGELSIIALPQPFDNFFGDVKFIKNFLIQRSTKSLGYLLCLKMSLVNYLIMKFFIRGTPEY